MPTVYDMSQGELVNPQDTTICSIIGAALCAHYPGHDWLIEADSRKGMIDIRNTSLSGQMGCRIPMNGFASSSELELLAMRYGGELLERYNMARGAFSEEARDALPVDFKGDIAHHKD